MITRMPLRRRRRASPANVFYIVFSLGLEYEFTQHLSSSIEINNLKVLRGTYTQSDVEKLSAEVMRELNSCHMQATCQIGLHMMLS